MKRYMLQQDNDCHWYVIPTDKEVDWNEWLEIPDDDERSWDVPEYAKDVGGSYTLVTFSEPEIK